MKLGERVEQLERARGELLSAVVALKHGRKATAESKLRSAENRIRAVRRAT